jgi:hypothetical protein
VLRIGDLYLVDFYCGNTEVPQDVRTWTNKNLGSRVFNAENCERHIWFGTEDDFKDFPDLTRFEGLHVREGAEAYSFLLRFMSGLVNPNGYDAPAGHRFFLAWEKINKRSPKNAEAYRDLIRHLTTDYQFIQRHVCQNIQADRPWLVARDMAGQTRGDTVIVIADTYEADGNMTNAAKRMMTTVNGSGTCPAKKIFYTCADAAHGASLRGGVESLKEAGKLRVPAKAFHLQDDLPKIMAAADRVYITVPVGKYPDMDLLIAECWRGRTHQSGAMVHTHADKDVIPGAFNPFDGLSGYHSAQAVAAESLRRTSAYDRLLTLGCEIADQCAQTRCRGQNTPYPDVRRRFNGFCADAAPKIP